MRYALEGRRPGETYFTPHGRVATHPIDGGATLTDEQAEFFRKDGLNLVPVEDQPPSEKFDIEKQVQDQAADAAYAEAVAAGAAAGEYGQVPKTLKTFHDIAHAGASTKTGPSLADPVIVPPLHGPSHGASKVKPSTGSRVEGASESDRPTP